MCVLVNITAQDESRELASWVQSLIDNASGTLITDLQCQFMCATVIIDLMSLSQLSLEANQKSPYLRRNLSVESEASTALVMVNIRPLLSQSSIGCIRGQLEVGY